MNAVVKHEYEPDDGRMIRVIERMASNPSVDVDKLERLLQMQERMQAKRAEVEFASAFAEMQTKLPAIAERGSVTGRYTYALWEDINTAIKPVLAEHGFALSFRMDFTDGISVTGVLTHKAGHSINTTIKLPADTSGNKPQVQAVASSVSYGKRYTAGALLNLTSHGEDDDAYRAVVELVSAEQLVTLREWIDSTATDEAKFLKWLKVESLADIPAKSYEKALSALRAKVKAK